MNRWSQQGGRSGKEEAVHCLQLRTRGDLLKSKGWKDRKKPHCVRLQSWEKKASTDDCSPGKASLSPRCGPDAVLDSITLQSRQRAWQLVLERGIW